MPIKTTSKQIAIFIANSTKKTLDKLCRQTGRSQREIIEAAIIECGPAIASKYAKSISLRKD